MNTIAIEQPARRRRRRHSAEFRGAVIQACRQPGVSMAAVALANGLNANMLRKWVSDADRKGGGEQSSEVRSSPAVPPDPSGSFVPLALSAPASHRDIRIELKRGGTVISVSWPTSAASECAAWLREWLR